MTSANFEHLLAPIQIGPKRAKNRMFLPPMERNFANPDWTVSERTKAHYGSIAAGGVGWLDVEATFVDLAGRARTHQLGLHDDRCIPGFSELTSIVHEHGALMGVELVHAGRNTSTAISGYEVVGPSPIACQEAGGDVPRALSSEDIDVIVTRYADAARRAEQAGFDAVELHSAHGYLPFAFVSSRTNHRSDEYGGALESRMRFALRVIDAIRSSVSERMAVGCRFSCDEMVPGGFTLDEAVEYAKALERAGVHYLSVSAGVYESAGFTAPPMAVPNGWLIPRASRIKAAVGIPVVCAGRFVDPRVAEDVLADGRVDLIAMGRALLTDPQLPRKVAEGRFDDVVHCIGCNQGCYARLNRQADVTCLVNPAVGRERDFASAATVKPRRIAVVGGGPAGMEAARVAAERGHVVTLFEREDHLGGMAAVAGAVPSREGWSVFVTDATRRLAESSVDVRLQTEPTLAELEQADAVIVATGARFQLRDVPGAEDGLVIDPVQALASDFGSIRRAVVIKDAEQIAFSVASGLLARGAEVHLVTVESELIDPPGDPGCLARLQETGGLRIHLEHEVTRVEHGEVVLTKDGAIGDLFAERVTAPDAIVICDERRSRSELATRLRDAGSSAAIYEIGDCERPRSALEAVYEGALAARRWDDVG